MKYEIGVGEGIGCEEIDVGNISGVGEGISGCQEIGTGAGEEYEGL